MPFLLTLIAADALAAWMIPALVATAGLEVITLVAKHSGDPALISGLYLAWSLPFVVYLAGRAWGVDWAASLRTLAKRSGKGTAVSAE